MADLTIVYMQQCCDLGKTTAGVGGYMQSYSPGRGWECSCKAYRYSRQGTKGCKHTAQLMAELCDWHEQYGERQTKDGVCPECGGPTETVKVGV